MLCQDRLRTDTENKSTAQLFYTAPHRRGVEGNGLRENGLFWSFLYVCPEPVLVKRLLLYTNGSKSPFSDHIIRLLVDQQHAALRAFLRVRERVDVLAVGDRGVEDALALLCPDGPREQVRHLLAVTGQEVRPIG